jgi:hypothetical protein
VSEKLKNERFEKESRRSSKITASLLKTSPTEVEKVRTVLDKADEKIKATVLAGEITIHKAYVETLKKPKPYLLKFRGNGLQAVLTISRDVGEVEWIILGFGEQPNLTLDPESSKILHLKSEKFE